MNNDELDSRFSSVFSSQHNNVFSTGSDPIYVYALYFR